MSLTKSKYAKFKELKACEINVKELNLKCGDEFISVNEKLCTPAKWLSIVPCFSWAINSNADPFPISSDGAGNVYKVDPESTLPVTMWDTASGVFTVPESGIYSLNFNNVWFCGGQEEGPSGPAGPFLFSEWTAEGNYTARWNISPGSNSCIDNTACCQLPIVGSTIYASPLAGNGPRNKNTGKLYSSNEYVVKLQAGQTFFAEAFASYDLIQPTSFTVEGELLFVSSQFNIYLLSPLDIGATLVNNVQSNSAVEGIIGPL